MKKNTFIILILLGCLVPLLVWAAPQYYGDLHGNQYGGFNTNTNSFVASDESGITNSKVFIGYGSIQFPSGLYGQNVQPGMVNQNYQNGISWWGQNPTLPIPWNQLTPEGEAFIHVLDRWGYNPPSAGSSFPTMHIAVKGALRLEPAYSMASPGLGAYMSIGNEDGNGQIFLNYCTSSTTSGVYSIGYSLPLGWRSLGYYTNALYVSRPGIQGYFAPTNGMTPAIDNSTLGELHFFSRIPNGDTSANTYGQDAPTYQYEVGRTTTNGWRLFGPVSFQQTNSIASSTNIALDFNTFTAQTIDLALVSSNYLYATNLNVYGGTTNFQPRTYRIRAGSLARNIRWPNWTFVSDSGATPSTVLAASNVLYLRLDGWGDGQTNVVCRWGTGVDRTFAFDADAASFFTRASISDATQQGAVDYLVKALKAANIWTNMIILYPFVGGAATPHSFNLISSSYTITWAGTVTHNANGITGNGTTGYGNTGWTNNLVNMSNSCFVAVYCRTTLPKDNAYFMGNAGTLSHMNIYRSGTSLNGQGPQSTTVPTLVDVSSDFQGILAMDRLSHTEIYGMNRSSIPAFSQVAINVPNMSMDVLAVNHYAVGHAGQTDANLALAAGGWGMSTNGLANLRTIVNNFETILSRNVP